MALIDVGIHPDPAGIGARRFPGRDAFSTLDLDAGEFHVSVFVTKRTVLDALQAGLDAIRVDMDAADAAIPASGEIAQSGPSSVPGYWNGTAFWPEAVAS